MSNDFDKTKGHIISRRMFKYPISGEAPGIPPVDAVTWDSENIGSNLLLSNNDLTVEHSSALTNYEQVFATEGKSSGKYYFEVLVDDNSGGNNSVGVQNGSESLEVYLGDTADGWGYMSTNRYYNSSSFSGLGYYVTGDVIQVAVDLDNGKIWWGLNNSWEGAPSTGTDACYSNLSGTIYPAVSLRHTVSELTGRFKAADLDYTPPSGFSAWES